MLIRQSSGKCFYDDWDCYVKNISKPYINTFVMKIFTIAFLTLLSCQLFAQIVVTDDDLQGGNTYTFTSGNTYLLDGIVILEPGGILNIEAGVVIKGRSNPTPPNVSSALVIAKGAQIFATGTADEPIIFTTEADDLEVDDDILFSDRGLWGGLVVLGDAPVAAPDGVSAFEAIGAFGDLAFFGGNNPQDNSGALEYVSIRHAGQEVAPGEELNGLTLAGVGDQTIIDHIEVYAGQDDGIEMKGGTVNLKHLSISFCSDESIDWDLGWRGKGQYWLALQDENSDRCGEHDGAAPDLEEPYSRPIIANVTYIGPGMNATESADEALLFRDRTGGIYTNSVFVNFPQYALQVEDRTDIADSYDHLSTGNLLLNCNYWWDFGAGTTWAELVSVEASFEDPTASVLVNLMENTQNTIDDPMITSIDLDPELFDPRLDPSSPALDGGCPIDDPFFDPVTYIGAFNSEEIWLRAWSGMAANRFFSFLTSTEEDLKTKTTFTVFPNPVNTEINITFEEDLSLSNTVISLMSIDGKVLRQKNLDSAYNTTLNVSDIPEGMYLVQIKTENTSSVRKVVIAR